MIKITVRELSDGRYEVEVPDRHHQAFDGRFLAVCAAYAFAETLACEGRKAVVSCHMDQVTDIS